MDKDEKLTFIISRNIMKKKRSVKSTSPLPFFLLLVPLTALGKTYINLPWIA